jgi:hypothetical protein
MAIIFHVGITSNGRTGNWVALRPLPAGVDPMREVVLSCSAPFHAGYCTKDQDTDDAGFFFYDAGRNSLGVVDYNKITVRQVGGSSASMFIHSYSISDEGPEGN